MALLFYSRDDDAMAWKAALQDRVPELDFRIWPAIGEPAQITMALVWLPPAGLLQGLPNLKVIFSLGAGVDAMLAQPDLPDVPLCRLVDRSLTTTMSEFILANVLYYHRDLDRFSAQATAARWQLVLPRPASARAVGVMGLGELGSDAARRLQANGFEVRGWSRSERRLGGIETFAGSTGLPPFLQACDMLICLLPLTAETEGILNAALFAQLPQGAVLIHVGRGRQLVPAALIAALDRGHLRGALLDVTPVEPLPPDDPLWRHPGIRITPHAASYALPETAAETIAANIERLRNGQPMSALVNRDRGY